jgi:hypothetical protein
MTEDIVTRVVMLIVAGAIAYVGVFRTRQFQRVVVAFCDRNPWIEGVQGVSDSGYFYWWARIAGILAMAVACLSLFDLLEDLTAVIGHK